VLLDHCGFPGHSTFSMMAFGTVWLWILCDPGGRQGGYHTMQEANTEARRGSTAQLGLPKA
jgi:hypothetical protein